MAGSMATFCYEQWYRERIAPALSTGQKTALMRKISDLTLKAPIWGDGKTDWHREFPELHPFSSKPGLTGLQLCAVMGAIAHEIGGVRPLSGMKPLPARKGA